MALTSATIDSAFSTSVKDAMKGVENALSTTNTEMTTQDYIKLQQNFALMNISVSAVTSCYKEYADMLKGIVQKIG